MTKLMDVTYWAQHSSYPGLPNHTMRGALYSEPAGLIFRPKYGNTNPLVIAWANLKETNYGSMTNSGLMNIVGLPITILTLGLVWMGDVTFFWAKFYDDSLDMTSSVVFIVSEAVKLEGKAATLQKRIWAERGKYYQETKKATKPKKRGE